MKTTMLHFFLLFLVCLSIQLNVSASNPSNKLVESTAPGNAMAFDGTNDYVDLGNTSAVQLTQGTIEAWIKTPNAGSWYRGIVVKQGAYGIFLLDNQLVLYDWTTGQPLATGLYLNDNKWHHVAFTFIANQPNGTIAYCDGKKVGTFKLSIRDQQVSLGIANGSVTDQIQFFSGSIDEVRIWNSIRTEQEITQNMYSELAGTETGLLAYYNFNQGIANADNSSITQLTDNSPSALNASLHNFSLNSSSSNFVESYAMVVPTQLQCSDITDQSFTITWQAPVTGSFDSYKLDVSTSPSFNSFVSGYQNLDCGTSLSKTITGLNPYTLYYARVRAENSNSSNQGGYNISSVKTLVDTQEYGNESWIGYVYTNTSWNGSNPTFIGAVLKGTITETANFNQNWGGSGPVFDGTTYNDHFLVRFKMKKYVVPGIYNITLSGDDGIRLIIDNGEYQCIDWSIHASSTRTMQLQVTEAGYKYFDIEFYEHEGGAWTSFNCEFCQNPNAPTKPQVSDIGLTSATITWDKNNNGSTVTYGYRIFDSANNEVNYGSISNTTFTVTGLNENTTYTCRMSAYNNCGAIVSSTSDEFSTLKSIKISTLAYKQLNGTSVLTGGNITDEGNSPIIARGVCWTDGTETPTTSSRKTVNGEGIGLFNSTVPNLSPDSSYYLRAYATNSQLTCYGEIIKFNPAIKIVTEYPNVNEQNELYTGGYIQSINTNIIERGVCWNYSGNPTTDDEHSSDGSGNGSFSTKITNLYTNYTYYFRAYARTENAVFYGETVTYNNAYSVYNVTSTVESSINGFYYYDRDINGQPLFININDSFYCLGYSDGSWKLGFNFGDDYIYEFFTSTDTGNPPLTGWGDGNTVELYKPTLSYSDTIFTESTADDGTISNQLTITINNQLGATFSGNDNDDFITNGKAYIANVPDGLEAHLVRTDELHLTLSLSGAATNHYNRNDLKDMKVQLTADAFNTINGIVPKGNVGKVDIDFSGIQLITIDTDSTSTKTNLADLPDVKVTNNAQFYIDNTTTIANLTIEPGATLSINSSLTVQNLILKANDTASFNTNINVTGTSINGQLSYQKTMTEGKVYFLSFPCDVNVQDISMLGGGVLGTDWYLQTYNCDKKAKQGSAVNWEDVSSTALTANKGYAFSIKASSGTKTLCFVLPTSLAKPQQETSVAAEFYDGTVGVHHKGWNFIGQPYLQAFDGKNVGINYLTTWDGTAYKAQLSSAASSLQPFEAFMVQVPSTTTLPFYLTNRLQTRTVNNGTATPTIVLSMSNTYGADDATLLVDNTYSSTYVINEDLEKQISTITNKPQFYSTLNGVNYAFNALAFDDITNLPLAYYSALGGASTISAASTGLSELSQLMLTDNKENSTTDLLLESYNFQADAGTVTNRFTLTAKRTITDKPSVSLHPMAYTQHANIELSQLPLHATITVYDITGRIRYTHLSTADRLSIPVSAGAYTVRITNTNQVWTFKLMCN